MWLQYIGALGSLHCWKLKMLYLYLQSSLGEHSNGILYCMSSIYLSNSVLSVALLPITCVQLYSM